MKKLGFGTMRLPLLDEKDQTSIDQAQVNQMADYFLEQGFTYVDTAYMYHDFMSEVAVRKAFTERHPRESFELADKMPVGMMKSKEDYDRIFNEQLEKTGAGYFDYYLIHDVNRNDIDFVEETDAFGFVSDMKKAGKIKHIGFSYHDNAEFLDEILTKHPETEFVQLQINYLDWDSPIIQSGKCYEVCKKHGKKVSVMEPIKGGVLANVSPEVSKLFKEYNKDASIASWAVRFAASLEETHMVLSGMSNFEQMQDNLSYMKEFIVMNQDEKAIVQQAVKIINASVEVPCTGCRYCVNHAPGCPKNIAIPEYFAMLNTAKRDGVSWAVVQAYRNTAAEHGAPTDCIACGQCEHHCPQHIQIIETLKKVPNYTEMM